MTDSNAGGQPLQFDRVEGSSEAMTCSNCGRAITTTYYDVNGNHVCPVCRGKLVTGAPKSGSGAFLPACGFGFAACLVGALIYFAVAAIFNLELALVAILIGYMVGWAVRKGANGSGGRKYQLVSVALVYLAVGLAYTGLVVKWSLEEAEKPTVTAAAAADSIDSDTAGDSTDADSDADADSTDVAASSEDDASGLASVDKISGESSIVMKVVGASLMVLTLPIVFIIGSLPSGIISVLIIGWGMQQAWRMTDGEEAAAMTVTGPYRINPPAEPAS